MSACNTFTEHVWKPGECKNCFKPKNLHRLAEGGPKRSGAPERAAPRQNPAPSGGRPNANLSGGGAGYQRGGVSARSGSFRPPVAKKPTIAVKPTMMLPCTAGVLDAEGNQTASDASEAGKASAFTVWNCNGLNRKRPGGVNNNEGEGDEIEGYGPRACRAPLSPGGGGGGSNNNGLTDVLKEIAGLVPSPGASSSRDLFFGRISSSYKRSLERGLPAAGCLAAGSLAAGSREGAAGHKRVSLSDSAEVISAEGGRFCYPEFSSEDDEDEDDEDDEEEESEGDGEHESWDESDEELLAMEIRMRGQPRFAHFRAATLSPVPFAAGKKWNTVPLRNRSLQRLCAVDYEDSLNGYPSLGDSNGLPEAGFFSSPEPTTSPESSSSLPEDSRTTSSSSSSVAPYGLSNGLHSPAAPPAREPPPRALRSPRATETHKAVLAIRLEDQEGQKAGAPLPLALPGQPITISFSPSEEQARPYRVVNLEKPPVCKPYTVVDVSASMAGAEDRAPDGPAPKPKGPSVSSTPSSPLGQPMSPLRQPTSPLRQPTTPLGQPMSPLGQPMSPLGQPMSPLGQPMSPLGQPMSPLGQPMSPLGQPMSPLGQPMSPMSPASPTSPTGATPSSLLNGSRKKSSSIRYQEVWTSSTSPRQKLPKVELVGGGGAPGPAVLPRYCSHKSAPTSPTAGLSSSSRTVPVKSPNLSEIKFNSYNNAGMPPFPIIIRDEPAYPRGSKNAVKVPIVINPSAYDNLAVYKSFLGVSGEPAPSGSRVASHTYEEIGSSESVKTPTPTPSPSTDAPPAAKAESVGGEDRKPGPVAQKIHELNARTTTDLNTVNATVASASAPAAMATATLSTQGASMAKSVTPGRYRKGSGDTATTGKEAGCLGTGTSHREKASTVLSQIVASIQPPRSPPESPEAQSKTCSVEELYALPPDAKETLSRPKSLFSTAAEGCLSKPRKDTLTKPLPKSHSASAPGPAPGPAPPTSPKSEPNAPFPPPRSTSSPYHASNLLQRHFGNWTKPAAAGGGASGRPSDGETSPGSGGEGGRRTAAAAESAKPKRWISFKSFFRRRRDEEEQRERAEREKEKGKLVGLDGTVIHMLPPPPIQRHHWFAEAKTDDPSQKPTLIFTYKPEGGASTEDDGVEETIETTQLLPAEELRETALLSPESPGQVGEKQSDKDLSQVPKRGPSEGPERRGPPVASLPARTEVSPQEESASVGATPASSLGEPDDDGSHSHSPASSTCSATYSNLGQSRANMIPLKHPRNIKASNDNLAWTEPEAPEGAPKATPPPLPKKTIARANTEPSTLGKDALAPRPKGEAKPGGTNLSVANPLYDLDSTWETASQSSSLSSEPRPLEQESGDSLERPAAGPGRPTNSLSCLASTTGPAAGRDKRGCRSAESLAGRGRPAGRGGASKPQRPVLYKGTENWEEVVGRIRGLHTDTLRKLAGKCEDRFMAGQKDHLRFGTDSWSDFRLTTGKPCCEAGDAVYYTASYAKDPLVNYAIKICRSQVKETQQQFFHSLAVRQSLPVHFNIQQDCGHFLADVPARLLPWEEEEEGEDEEQEKAQDKAEGEERKTKEASERTTAKKKEEGGLSAEGQPAHVGGAGTLRSRVVVITREVPFQTVADFVREGAARHARNPDLYERQVCVLLLQLCSGLEHMKPYHVTHCDLRLENLLLVHCQPGNPWNLELLEPNNNAAVAGSATCPARLIISNFSQAKQKTTLVDPGVLRDQSRLAPEIVTATQYRKCDEFQTGILIYEMLHQPNPFEEMPELKEKEYTCADLPPLPARSLYSQGLQQLASLLLNANPSERIRMADARACLQCLLWGPREDLFQALSCSPGLAQRDATLQNWLDLKRTLMMIKFAERSLDSGSGVSLEDWLCCQYLAFSSPETLARVVRILQHPPTQL
ncbi:inactive tyrosine-protein kinase PEAK1 [Anguilla anguilla]|uniref:inactive tyrosine-protein kinase PEAK1 n=1 Tax=Anguilla anguilla TaxID=7936 RepID=UPI0015AE3E6F|nr:inactive tyrosine-protein kinase PEAK1 [Anguilla anguilla]XP_035251563.1 inactive tyrosine-protein kinase PEAK1 [Anguilla anguilla]